METVSTTLMCNLKQCNKKQLIHLNTALNSKDLHVAILTWYDIVVLNWVNYSEHQETVFKFLTTLLADTYPQNNWYQL